MRGKAPALVLLLAGSTAPAAAQTPRVLPPGEDSSATSVVVNAAPVVFRHDLFYLGLASSFSAVALPVTSAFPGPLGLTEDQLADRIPGAGFRRNGVPAQAGEYDWFGGDGEDIALRSGRTDFTVEPLGFPYYSGNDPLLTPPLGDSLYLVAAPLFGSRPVELVSWRDPYRPDSLIAVALHANGPDGFSHTGGRLEGPIGGGFEFDGEFYRDFSDGTLPDAAADDHTLDFELRRRVSGWPTRLRFRQMRGERKLAFRWEDTDQRALHRYLLSDLEAEAARPDSAGEWLFHVGLRHEDQKLANPLLPDRRTWFGRTLTVSASRLLSGTTDRLVSIEGHWRPGDSQLGLPEWKALELSGMLQRHADRADLLLSGAIGTQSRVSRVWRLALAAAWRPAASQRIVAAIGRSLAAPSFVRQWLPAASGPGGYAEAGDAALGPATHDEASLAWNLTRSRARVSLLAAAGRSIDLPVWQPVGTPTSSYRPIAMERRYAGVGASASVRPHTRFKLEGALDYTFVDRWQGAGDPVYAPKITWYSRLAWSVHLAGTHADLAPSVEARGAASGTLPADYATAGVGVDLTVKQLLIFWRLDNLSDVDYRTGGAALDYGRHFAYGFRWEFVN